MTHSTRIRVRLFTVLLLLIMPAGLTLVEVLNYPSVKVRARRWASRIERNDVTVLASTVSESLPLAYRKALRARMTPAERSDFWIRRIESYVTNHDELSQSVIADLRAMTALLVEAGPEFFSRRVSARLDPRAVRLLELGRRVIQNMDKVEAATLLIMTGPPDNSPLVSEPLRLRDRVARWVNSVFTVHAGPFDCDCSQYQDFCWMSGWNYECLSSTCDPSEDICDPPGSGQNCYFDPGCGLIEMEACDGLCWNTAF